MNHVFRHRACWPLAMCLALVACGGSNSPEQSIASARSYLDRQDAKAAIIELKNALQKAPDSADARFLLGRALLDEGDAVSAVVELQKAAALRHPDAIVLPVLARALNALGQGRQLITQYGAVVLDDVDAGAHLKLALASAYAAQGDRAKADAELAAALKAAPDNTAARLLQARVKAGDGDVQAALALTESILAKSPAAEDAWLLKGDLLALGLSDAAGAVEAYRRALALRPNAVAARAALVDSHLRAQQIDLAVKEVAELRKLRPQLPQLRWFDAQIAWHRGDMKEATRLAEQLVAAAPGDVRFRYLAGAAHLRSGALSQAENAFGKALQAAPDNPAIHLALAQVQLRLGQPAKALATIQPLLDAKLDDGPLLAVAAQAHLVNGDTAQAQAYFERAAQANPNDARSRTALALTKLSQGDGSAAIGDLQHIAEADKGSIADLGLISALLRRNEHDAALAAVDRLAAKQAAPGALTAFLRGTVLLAKRDAAAARASFEQALKLDPKYAPAASRLAAMDLADQQPDAAKKRFDDLLAVDPTNAQALLARADLRSAVGGTPAEVADLLAAAVKANPSAAAPRVKLIEHHLRRNDARAALATAQDGIGALPDNPQLLDALGTAQLAAGEPHRATASFNRLLALRPRSPIPYLRLAAVQSLSKETAGAAIQTLQRGLAVLPASPPIQRNLIGQLAAAGRHKEALVVAAAMQKQQPAEAAGHVVEGDVEAARKNWPAAIAAYRAAQSKRRSTDVAVSLHSALAAAKRQPEADRLAADWLGQSPGDRVFLSYLGDRAILLRDYAGAESRYREVLRVAPADVRALNNVAWLMAEQQKAGALEYAEKANELQPNEPPFLDTLATALAADNQLDKAVAAQRKAVELQPDAAGFRLRLARLLLKSGDKPAARVELDRLAKLGDRFAGQDEVSRLLKTF